MPCRWVEKFEAKRKELEQQQHSQQPPVNSSSSSNQAGAGHRSAAPAPVPVAASPPPADQPGRQPIPWPKVALQLLQLTVAVAALILWPASLYRTGLYNGKVWLLILTYVLFFGGGSVWRLVRFGPLANRKKDKQAKSLGTRAAWALFVAMMPILHWGAIGSYMKAKAAASATAAAAAAQQGVVELGYTPGPVSSLTLYDIIGLGLLAGAVWLNWQAARHLGRAYDRVVQPDALVTSGPYAWVQHPIYSSYMMLFCGYAMVLHSFGYALLALVVCLVYYKSRVALEADVLRDAFGEKYVQYQQRTKLFVPFVL